LDTKSAIITKQVSILGETIALKKAGKVEGIILNDLGKVASIHGDGKIVLEKLLKEYASLTGEATILFSKEAIAPLIKENSSLILPEELKL